MHRLAFTRNRASLSQGLQYLLSRFLTCYSEVTRLHADNTLMHRKLVIATSDGEIRIYATLEQPSNISGTTRFLHRKRIYFRSTSCVLHVAAAIAEDIRHVTVSVRTTLQPTRIRLPVNLNV